ncbi:acyl-CoA dehydrogenase family protein [Streptomyces sp. YGL11-2]|uniref:acyl-CoA dehydrogenase family protein n=1 Tax=Streptomyces sp. YGL11-2 TaxID=3414028 RepID=UPI003CFBA1E7
MDPTPTEDRRHIRAAAAALLTDRRTTAHARAVRETAAGHAPELWKEMTRLGWPALVLPERYGGLGAGFADLCLLCEELGRHQIPSPLLTTVACAALPLARHGSPAQCARWLAAVADGGILTYARAAPHGHWGAPGSTVTATPSDDGFHLDGTALFVPYAGTADAILVMARTGAAAGLTALLVPTATPGIRRRRLTVVGNTPEYGVDFTRTVVPASHVVGPVGGGSAVAETAAALGTAALCAEMTGGAQAVLDMTVAHARTRQQFGRPIGSFQAVQQHCADMAVAVLGSRLNTHEAAHRLARHRPAALEVSLAKAYVSERYQQVCALAHQVHGAIGFTAEHDLHLYTRHATATALAFGDADHHISRVAESLGV